MHKKNSIFPLSWQVVYLTVQSSVMKLKHNVTTVSCTLIQVLWLLEKKKACMFLSIAGLFTWCKTHAVFSSTELYRELAFQWYQKTWLKLFYMIFFFLLSKIHSTPNFYVSDTLYSKKYHIFWKIQSIFFWLVYKTLVFL